MRRIALDTNFLVAALCAWHERHCETLASLEAALGHGDRLVVASHSLVEAYSVLTRLPAPHRLAPATAVELLERNLCRFEVVALGAEQYWNALLDCAARGIAGGTVYDALIATAVTAGGAESLWTLNERHMKRVVGEALTVETPRGG